MSLSQEERNAIVAYRVEKARIALETEDIDASKILSTRKKKVYACYII